jgi:siroheme synthase-like protein
LSWATLPVEVLVRGRKALVIGASGEIASKVHRLLEGGADVLVVTNGTAIDPAVASLAAAGALRLERRDFDASEVADAAVVFVATELESIGAALAADARGTGRLVSTLDRPEASTFINPAVARRNGISFAISTGGAVPGLVKILRRELERALGRPKVGAFVAEVTRARARLPRGERGREAQKLLAGLSLDVRWTYPLWFRKRRPPILRNVP